GFGPGPGRPSPCPPRPAARRPGTARPESRDRRARAAAAGAPRPRARSFRLHTEQGPGLGPELGLAAGDEAEPLEQVAAELPPRPGEVVGHLGLRQSELLAQLPIGWTVLSRRRQEVIAP